MEGFNVHGAVDTFQEHFQRKAYSMEKVVKPPNPADLQRELRCAKCDNLALPTFSSCQKEADDCHLICDSCAKKFASGCPVIAKGQLDACRNKQVGFEKGMPSHIAHILYQWQLPYDCRAKKYGCTFIGTISELQQHEMFFCTYRKLCVCYQPSLRANAGVPCGEMFNNFQELNHHLKAHGFVYEHNQKSVHHLGFKDVSDLTEKWIINERRLVDYPKGHFCLLTVRENKTHIRMWLREIEPQGNSATSMQIYTASTPAGQSETVNRFKSIILPRRLEDFANVAATFFEVNKDFLRHTADDRKNGNVHFSVAFTFLDSCFPESSKNETKGSFVIDYANYSVNGGPDAGRADRPTTLGLVIASHLRYTEGLQANAQKQRSYDGGHHRGGMRKSNGGRRNHDAATKESSAAATTESRRGFKTGRSSTNGPKRTPRVVVPPDTSRAPGSSNPKDTSNAGHEEKKRQAQAYRDRWMGTSQNRSENNHMSP